ncbi:MAG: NADH-quinone oxidoreductase subunit J [Desulfosoma sp.]
MELVLFVAFSSITLVSAAAVVLHPHPLKSALFLIVTFFAMGGLYLLLQAEFIALMQVLVYAGAVMVLFLFVIMLLNLKPRGEDRSAFKKRLSWALPLVLVFVGAVLTVVTSPLARLGPSAQQGVAWVETQGGNVRAVGRALFTSAFLPFEVTSIALLVAVVGVIVLAKKERK